MGDLRIEGITTRGNGPFRLRAKAGECVGIAGPSDRESPFFLRAAADLDPHDGRAPLGEAAAESIPGHRWRRRVGLLPAESRRWADRAGKHSETADERWLAEMGFDPKVMDRTISRLSSGERQRPGLLRLLAVRPQALLLDEPAANLDGDNVRRAERIIAEYRRMFAPPALWVSHDPDQIRRVADRHLRLAREGFLASTPTGPSGAAPSGNGVE